MSDSLVRELEMDLEREKEKIFFHKYRYHIIIVSLAIIFCFSAYQFYQSYRANLRTNAAVDYYHNFVKHYDNIESLTDENLKYRELSQKTLQNFPTYYAMSKLLLFKNAQEQEATDAELLTITTEYMRKQVEKKASIYDSLLQLYHLSLKSNDTAFDKIEADFSTYINHPFAFKYLAYETLFMLALRNKNSQQAIHYLQLLKQYAKPQDQNKLKIYATHPLIAPLLAKLVKAKKEKQKAQKKGMQTNKIEVTNEK